MLPSEIYQQISLNLPLSDLLRFSQASRLFYQIARWCLTNPEYYSEWLLSLRENSGEVRVIPLDVEETKAQLPLSNLYIFKAKVRTISWCYEVINQDLLHISLASIPFTLRFKDAKEVIHDGKDICLPFGF